MDFHFLRPEWLWLLIPTAWILWKLWRHQQDSGNWHAIIDPAFQPVLLGPNAQQSQFPWGFWGLGFIWFTVIFALSGPTWKAVEQTAEKSGQGTVILLDMSLSMLADDLKPNRISRAKYKLTDLLKAHPELATGLVVYSGSAHSLTPVSEDNQTLLSLIKTLTPIMMPAFGSNAEQGIDKALALIAGSQVKQGHLIWVLDDIEAEQIDAVAEKIADANISVSLLAIGTRAGGPISIPNYGLLKDDDGKIVVAKLPFDRLQKLANRLNASFSLIQNDDSDLDALLPPEDFNTQKSDELDPKKLEHWLDNGIYLLVGVLPLMALAFRRGWLLSLGGLIILVPVLGFFPTTSFAQTPSDPESKQPQVQLLDILKSPDQQGYEKWQQQNYEAALDRFEDPQWKGASLYRLGKYNEAAKQFKQQTGPEARFNEGNAMAQLGQFEQAKDQYLQALKARPNWTEAQENLQLIEKLLEQQRQQKQQQESQSNQAASSEKKQQGEQQPQPQTSEQIDNDLDQPMEAEDQQNQDKNQQASQDAEQQDSPQKETSNAADSAENSSENQDNKSQSASSGGEPQAADEPSLAADGKASEDSDQGKAPQKLTEQEQAQQTWLNQIPDDPGLFLKRKFEYQYQKENQGNETSSSKIW